MAWLVPLRARLVRDDLGHLSLLQQLRLPRRVRASVAMENHLFGGHAGIRALGLVRRNAPVAELPAAGRQPLTQH